ncbi:hypothetical protein NP493_340g00001 [Ridgeia piscesae]|uniref:MADF domain-containing protein n=1 Tax=Ridgeia piscesae TaxID=27915 RepID=A0AAD9L3I5_RIDPI|nr:hypothetical protein NP493_340g00001 [Ridgeia piscesae]
MAATNMFICETIAEDKLVAIWEEFPCLYDVRSESFRNRDLRDEAIQTISDEVEQSADWVKNKIRQLRNSYGKASKMASSGRARKQVTKRTAWLRERLQFLAPFVSRRDTVCSLNDVCIV